MQENLKLLLIAAAEFNSCVSSICVLDHKKPNQPRFAFKLFSFSTNFSTYRV